MEDSSFVVFWSKNSSYTASSGSEITFKNDRVTFYNPLLTPGRSIHHWMSKADDSWTGYPILPSLPVIIPGEKYYIKAFYHAKPLDSIQLSIDFYKENDEWIESYPIGDIEDSFVVPEETNYYKVSLINLNNKFLEFEYFILKPYEYKFNILVDVNQFKLVAVLPKNYEKDCKIRIITSEHFRRTGSYYANDDEIHIYLEKIAYKSIQMQELEKALKRIIDDNNLIDKILKSYQQDIKK